MSANSIVLINSFAIPNIPGNTCSLPDTLQDFSDRSPGLRKKGGGHENNNKCP
jgi:hypothetical protein